MPSAAKILLVALIFGAALASAHFVSRQLKNRSSPAPRGPYSVEDRVRQYGDAVRRRLEPDFRRAGVTYPPDELTLLAFKQERMLEVYAASKGGERRFIRAYPILAVSGHLGPKLREGDLQAPEGLYRVENLNPNSLYHLALRVDYPNVFDRAHAAAEGRTSPGGDIMIHGSSCSIGCLAMGDLASEDLFVLAALTGAEKVRILISPIDLRTKAAPAVAPEAPAWLPGLYQQLKAELIRYPVQPAVG